MGRCRGVGRCGGGGWEVSARGCEEGGGRGVGRSQEAKHAECRVHGVAPHSEPMRV